MAAQLRYFADPRLIPLAVAIETLDLDPDNELDHTAESVQEIVKLLVRFGWRDPVHALKSRRKVKLVSRGNRTLMAARWLAEAAASEDLELRARAVGHESWWSSAEPPDWLMVPALFFADDTATRVAWRISHNKSAEAPAWDWGILAENMAFVSDEVDWGDLGWSAAEFAELFEDADPTSTPDSGPGGDAPDDRPVPVPPANPVTQVGDLWLLGDHRLLCGDSFDADARERLLEGQLADMALMDPPFAIYGSSTGIGADIADDKMIRPFFAQLGFVIVQSIREFAHAYVCCDWRSFATIWDGMKGAKLSPKNALIWNKGGGLGSMYAHCYEMIAFFVREPPPKSMKQGKATGHRTVYKRNMLDGFTRPSGDERLHNAAKPVAMLAELIENSSDAGDVVLDLFSGSGSVIIAGERTGRRVRAMELERGMCDVTVKRWQAETGRLAKRLDADGKKLKGIALANAKAPA